MRNSLPLIVTIAFSIVGVIGDYFLKLASEQHSPLKSGTFYFGFIVYASTAFGWVYVMGHLKLATIGAIYSVSMIPYSRPSVRSSSDSHSTPMFSFRKFGGGSRAARRVKFPPANRS